jgi:hypothetical protein
MRTLYVCLLMVLGCAAGWAAGNPAVGKWDCSSVGENGAKLNWQLIVKEDAGQLAASVVLDGTDIAGLEPKLEGGTLTFKIRINDHEVVTIELRIDGNKLDGRFEGKESGKATITGTKVV